jgi:hypothetical protein
VPPFFGKKHPHHVMYLTLSQISSTKHDSCEAPKMFAGLYQTKQASYQGRQGNY